MNYVLATSRLWNEEMAERLETHTGKTFHLVTKKENLTMEWLNKIQPRYLFFPHWSYIVSEKIFSRFECIIFHMTDLPYGRGGSPLQNLILKGHRKTKISAIQCVREMDAGAIYMKRPLCLEGAASEIFIRAADIIEGIIKDIVEKEPTPSPQKGDPVLFKRRKPRESDLNQASAKNLNDFFDFIRMLDADGYPRAFIDIHGHRIEFSRVQLEQEQLVGTFTISQKKKSHKTRE